MRCHFQLVRGANVLPDTEGIEVAEARPEILRTEIARALREIAEEDGHEPTGWRGWQLRVVTGDGSVIISVALDQHNVSAERS
jgi:hypothetical protein